ncbi:MAG TPA: exo-beta-N-acetylmuramidase NamZ domain-containing protein, partial [Candidatus Kapabacteria bacterium]|nr:exo-beta-N-acetylmuramidase NamZ domain-containing protein [Candidatus Kapabacteria bacterium]
MEIGIDVFKEDTDTFLKERNIVLITGSANVDSVGEPVYRVVKKAVGKRLKTIWSLQHGFFIDKQDNMIFSDSFYWKELDIEVKSLYGENLLPRPEWLGEIEALVIDLFDVGTRVYTFVNHVIMLLKYLSGRNIDIVVLDRPNPLNGLMLEGNIMDPGYFSIVGQLPVPMRHGLTVGEYLSYALSYYDLDLQLEVVQVRDWERGQFFQGIWTYPSPNMPTFQT